MKHLFRIVMTIGLTLLGLALAWQFRPTLILFISSLSLAAALRPLVARLEQRDIKRSNAILLFYAAMLLIIGGLITVYVLYLQRTGEISLARTVEGYDRQIALIERLSGNEEMVRNALPNSVELVNALLSLDTRAQETILGFTGSIASNAIFFLAVLALTFYWLTEITHFERLLLSLLPIGGRLKAHSIWLQVEGAVGAYIRTTVATVILTIALLFPIYALIGAPFALTLAIISGLSHLVPRIGPILGVIPAALIAYLANPLQAVLVLVIGIIIQVVAVHFNNRILQRQNTTVSPLLQSLLLLAMVQLVGVSGLLLGPPLAAMISQIYPFLATRTPVAPLQQGELELLETELTTMKEQADPQDREFQQALQRSTELLDQSREAIAGSNA